MVAAPVFSEVGHWTLNHLSVIPSTQHRLSRPVERQREKIRVRNPDMPGLMPDVQGLGVRDVLKKAQRLGVTVVVKGSGLAIEQSPAAGTPIKRGKLLTVTFRPPC